MVEQESRPHNNTYPKVAIQWLIKLCFPQVRDSVLADSLVIRILLLRQIPNR